MDYFKVANWEHFQHYKDRNPPWIKLHFSMLSSADWVTLDDASRVLAVACMLIASRHGGLVPNNSAYLKRVAYLNRAPNFKPLIECGFLEPASECKQMLAEFRAETETEERQRRGETEADSSVERQKALSAGGAVNGNAVAYIPCNDGSEFGVSKELAEELAKLYPAVNVPQTLNEIRGWNLANPSRRKTRRGVLSHINAWMTKEQNRGPQ